MRAVAVFLSVLLVFLFLSVNVQAVEMIRCASTTSTQNSGLFDYILPMFEKETGIKVNVVAVGTGAAFEIGKRGDADVLLVHAKDDELRLVKEGWFVDRHDVMYNDFIIVGPPSDPAGIKAMKSASSALKSISEKGSPFVSRGDNSGTHKKEKALWKAAGVGPEGKWYMEVGQGMAKTLRIAAERRAYTLTDRGTYLSIRDKESLDLNVLLEGDPALFNQYGVMAVNPEKHPHVKYDGAKAFTNWLVSKKGQEAIAAFKDAKGNQLFHPNAME
jgi:tungstate transport system substrate-binding protein